MSPVKAILIVYGIVAVVFILTAVYKFSYFIINDSAI